MTRADLAVQLLEHVNDRDDEGLRRLLKTGAEISLGEAGPHHVYERRADLHRFLRQLRHALPRYTVAADRIVETDDGALVDWEAFATGARGEMVESAGTLVLDVDDGRISGIRVRVRDTALVAGGDRLVA